MSEHEQPIQHQFDVTEGFQDTPQEPPVSEHLDEAGPDLDVILDRPYQIGPNYLCPGPECGYDLSGEAGITYCPKCAHELDFGPDWETEVLFDPDEDTSDTWPPEPNDPSLT